MDRWSSEFGGNEVFDFGNNNKEALDQKGDLTVNSNYLEIRIIPSGSLSYIIGKVINLNEFDSIISSTVEEESYTFEFILEKEKNETPKKKGRNGGNDWKTVNIMKKFKALKRYRILKRIKKLISLKN